MCQLQTSLEEKDEFFQHEIAEAFDKVQILSFQAACECCHVGQVISLGRERLLNLDCTSCVAEAAHQQHNRKTLKPPPLDPLSHSAAALTQVTLQCSQPRTTYMHRNI